MPLFVREFDTLVEKLDQGIALRRKNIEDGDRFLRDIVFVPPDEYLDEFHRLDACSSEYLELQMAMWRAIAGTDHDVKNEGHESGELELRRAFPFHGSPKEASYWLVVYGHILHSANLKAGARVLEVGFGSGGLTEIMVRSGLDVTAVEIRDSNCKFLERRVAAFGGRVTAMAGDIADVIDRLVGDFDACIFCESFHHIKEYSKVLGKLRAKLKADGALILAAEPVHEDGDPILPYPWGLRLDGGSLGAARDVGWVEFGFNRGFLTQLMSDLGFVVQTRSLPDYGHASLLVCRGPDFADQPVADEASTAVSAVSAGHGVGATEIDAVLDLIYRGVLRRPPDPLGRAAYTEVLKSGTSLPELIKMFVECPEFTASKLTPVEPGQEPASRFIPTGAPSRLVETSASAEQLSRLIERTGRAWKQLGAETAFHSVLTSDAYLPANLNEASKEEFWRTGAGEVSEVETILARHDFGDAAEATCVEYGCGVGRVTSHLARLFKQVHAYDISPPHIAAATERAREVNLKNISFHLIESDVFNKGLFHCDFFYSKIVFQHNPPPVIAKLLSISLDSLTPGGIAVFQVPTFGADYAFNVAEYLADSPSLDMELHLLPQSQVFDLIAKHDCELLEVREDASIGLIGKWISNTFVVRRRRDEIRRRGTVGSLRFFGKSA